MDSCTRRLASLLFLLAAFLGTPSHLLAQDEAATFRSFQFSFDRVNKAWTKNGDTLARLFHQQGIVYPTANLFLREFKAQNELELWARNDDTSAYKLIKTYRICALSGLLGPKRAEGDRQVPEGFYFIDDYNPKSDFHLSMLLNYPNYSDRILGNKTKPGGDIYIHGSCVTVGCIPLTDPVIQELYTVCLSSRLAGQTYIPVHIFPTRFDKTGLNFLGREYKDDAEKQKFWVNLKAGYDYFEQNRRLQPVMYTVDGRYVF